MIVATFQECVEEIDTAQPYAGCFCDGRIVSICRSVRKERGHEAGIETLPAYRRRGYGQAVLKRWTAAVRQQGFVPPYTALTRIIRLLWSWRGNRDILCMGRLLG